MAVLCQSTTYKKYCLDAYTLLPCNSLVIYSVDRYPKVVLEIILQVYVLKTCLPPCICICNST